MFYFLHSRKWTISTGLVLLTLACGGCASWRPWSSSGGVAAGTAEAVPVSKPAPVPLRVLAVGDSITQGGKRGRDEFTYRYALQRLLHERGIAFDFVGGRRDGLHEDAVWPEIAPGVAFDLDHEGYYGRKTAYVSGKVVEVLPTLAQAPNVVLVHLGTNDQNSADPASEVVAPLRELVGALRDCNPDVAVFFGHLNFNDSKGANAIRPMVEALAAELSTERSPVVTVHHYRGWNEKPRLPDSDTFDWAHPNLQGQEKMARAWLAAMEPTLARFGWPASAGEATSSTGISAVAGR